MKRVTQKSIAEQLGVKPSYLNDVLRGRRPCSKKMAARLEQFTGIDCREFLYPKMYPISIVERRAEAANE